MSETQDTYSTYPLVPADRVIAMLAACGATPKQIAGELQMEPNYVEVLLDEEPMKAQVKLIAGRLFSGDPKKRFRAMANRSLELLEDMQTDKKVKDGIRARVAEQILDRAFGKPEQTVNLEGSLTRRIYERLANEPPIKTEADGFDLTKLKPVEALPAAGQVGVPNDLDGWAEKNL